MTFRDWHSGTCPLGVLWQSSTLPFASGLRKKMPDDPHRERVTMFGTVGA